jgi:hypothetical protein
MSSFLQLNEIEERLEDLKKYKETLKSTEKLKNEKTQTTIDYYNQLLNLKKSSILQPKEQKELTLSKLRFMAQESALKKDEIFTTPTRKESIFSHTPQRISKSNSEIILNDDIVETPKTQQKYPILFYDSEKKSSLYNSGFLDPYKWGSAYSLLGILLKFLNFS